MLEALEHLLNIAVVCEGVLICDKVQDRGVDSIDEAEDPDAEVGAVVKVQVALSIDGCYTGLNQADERVGDRHDRGVATAGVCSDGVSEGLCLILDALEDVLKDGEVSGGRALGSDSQCEPEDGEGSGGLHLVLVLHRRGGVDR